MSQRAVEQLIGRLVTDARFLKRAASALETACMEEGYDLTAEERRIVASLDFGLLQNISDRWLEDRLKRSNGAADMKNKSQ